MWELHLHLKLVSYRRFTKRATFHFRMGKMHSVRMKRFHFLSKTHLKQLLLLDTAYNATKNDVTAVRAAATVVCSCLSRKMPLRCSSQIYRIDFWWLHWERSFAQLRESMILTGERNIQTARFSRTANSNFSVWSQFWKGLAGMLANSITCPWPDR